MKNIILLTTSVILIALLWYLFVYPHELQVRFRAKTTPGSIVQTLKLWDKSSNKLNILDQDRENWVRQKVNWNNGEYILKWNFTPINDSLTKVIVNINEPGRGLINKFLVPLSNSNFENNSREAVKDFYNKLKEHLDKIRVKVDGESVIPDSFCVCRNVKSSQLGKAKGMMENFSALTNFIVSNDLEANGMPMVRVRNWDREVDSLRFSFCYPILEKDSLPKIPQVYYKKI